MLPIPKVKELLLSHYGIDAKITTLAGDEDFNYKIEDVTSNTYVLKITSKSVSFVEFQSQLLNHLASRNLTFETPKCIPNKQQKSYFQLEIEGQTYVIRLLSWVAGRLWIDINPKTPALRYELGTHSGTMTDALASFQTEKNPAFDQWHLEKSLWTKDAIELFSSSEKEIVSHFQQLFESQLPLYNTLRKSVIHGDINDFNILLSSNKKAPTITGFIDFGDAHYTQTINELAITIAYGVMHCPNPLEAACEIVAGFHSTSPILDKELEMLFALVAMRWITTVTMAAKRRNEEGQNDYHFVSESAAWDCLTKWYKIHPNFAWYAFRNACGKAAHPKSEAFKNWALEQSVDFNALFPEIKVDGIHLLDLKVSSQWLGNKASFNDLENFSFKIAQLQQEFPSKLIAGGYIEPRPLYTANTYEREGNQGNENRTVHLGVDFWLPAGTAVQSIFEGKVFAAVDDAGYKEYGGLVILEHKTRNLSFFSLYGHLSVESALKHKKGDWIKKGDLLGNLGTPVENGSWSPHLHFQLMLDIFDYEIDFPGVCFSSEMELWKSVCPDPNLLFKNKDLTTKYDPLETDLIDFRKKHLGKSLSLSYSQPLHIVRGDGVHLIDSLGRKYLDTVNNVAHVGHEHPVVVRAVQTQTALLNTNTRYLHPAINAYAKALLKKLPPELSVLHFVNSGSEANELALRMAKTITNSNQFIALESGYHGNTNLTIDVSSYKFDRAGGRGRPASTHLLPSPDTFRGPYRDEDATQKHLAHAKEILDHLTQQNLKPAGLIAESILSCAGQIVPPKDYFNGLYRLVREAGGLCIADEVQTGFGRVGKSFWAFELFEVIPDIVTMGKPAGNGHPLAVVACTEAVAAAFDNGMEFFNTFGGNPVSCRVGKAVLDVIDDENLQENAQKTGDFLKSELHRLQKLHPIIGQVRGEGLFLGVELVDAALNPLPEQTEYLIDRMRDHQILMSLDGPDHNVIKIKPPLCFSEEDARYLIHYLDKILSEDFLRLPTA